MTSHTCSRQYCTRPADIKLGDLALCARHYASEVES